MTRRTKLQMATDKAQREREQTARDLSSLAVNRLVPDGVRAQALVVLAWMSGLKG